MSPAVRLSAFLVLLVAMFAGAYAAGAALGPVSATNTPQHRSGPMHMTGAGPAGLGAGRRP